MKYGVDHFKIQLTISQKVRISFKKVSDKTCIVLIGKQNAVVSDFDWKWTF